MRQNVEDDRLLLKIHGEPVTVAYHVMTHDIIDSFSVEPTAAIKWQSVR